MLLADWGTTGRGYPGWLRAGVRWQLPECTAVSPLAAGHSSTGSSVAPSFPLRLLLVTRYLTTGASGVHALLLLCQSHFPRVFEPHSFQTLFPLLTLCVAFASGHSGVTLLSTEDQSLGSWRGRLDPLGLKCGICVQQDEWNMVGKAQI